VSIVFKQHVFFVTGYLRRVIKKLKYISTFLVMVKIISQHYKKILGITINYFSISDIYMPLRDTLHGKTGQETRDTLHAKLVRKQSGMWASDAPPKCPSDVQTKSLLL
jgi:hypothetical protein